MTLQSGKINPTSRNSRKDFEVSNYAVDEKQNGILTCLERARERKKTSVVLRVSCEQRLRGEREAGDFI